MLLFMFTSNAYESAALPQIPKTLRNTLKKLERSEIARATFEPKIIDHYLQHGRLEQQAYDQSVTDWELIRNFERI